jgi:uncharacterized protein YerC
MELLHNDKEIRFFNDLFQCANEIEQLSKKYRIAELAQQAVDYKEKVQIELNKYNYLIGKEVKGITNSGIDFIGVIEKITHFNNWSSSVRVNVRYTSCGDYKFKGGFDGYALKELTLI